MANYFQQSSPPAIGNYILTQPDAH